MWTVRRNLVAKVNNLFGNETHTSYFQGGLTESYGEMVEATLCGFKLSLLYFIILIFFIFFLL